MNNKQAESIIDNDDKSDVGKTNIEADEADKLEPNAQHSHKYMSTAWQDFSDELWILYAKYLIRPEKTVKKKVIYLRICKKKYPQ